MGQVYQATDTKLNRQVALKILPEAFATDPDRLARFQREAQVLASLNHPGIAAIYGIEEQDDTRALVLELVEGPTLADLISKGPIPIDEALPIAKQIAEALEAAHEAGVIHRDLKPANIKVREDGTVKVLDFGLAKALDPNPTGDPSQSPTLTAAATQMGVIMGTAAYMSPEQARGKPVDKRADIWSFGVVLYEMLTGQRAFQGEDVSLTLAAVMTFEPDLDRLPDAVAPTLKTYLARCLAKEPKERVRDIGDVRLALAGAFDVPAPPPDTQVAVRQLQVWQRPTALVLAAVTLVAVTGLAVWSLARPGRIVPVVTRFVVTPSADAPLFPGAYSPEVAISPDGTRIVYGTGGVASRQLHLRQIDQLGAVPLRGTERGNAPFFSPDGQFVGFKDDVDVLRKVSVLGGPAVTITPLGGESRGMSWTPDGAIIFATTASGGLLRVSDAGGEPERLTTVDPGEMDFGHWWPSVLPNRRGVLFTAWSGSAETSRLAVFSFETGNVTYLLTGGSQPHYLASGHIVYGVGGTLWAVGFDLERLELSGPSPVPVLENVDMKPAGAANFTVSESGTLAFISGQASPNLPNRTLVWVDRQGRETPINLPAGDYRSPRVSPDGTRVAVTLGVAENENVWVADLSRGTLTPATVEPGPAANPLWMPEGQEILFSISGDVGEQVLMRRPADGTGSAERVIAVETLLYLAPTSWSSDGTRLAVGYVRGATARDIGIVTLDGEPSWTPLLATEVGETAPALSPDGAWIAYSSDRSGVPEIYLERFPDLGERVAVSVGGAMRPRWSPRGDELFYRRYGDGAMMSVPIDTAAELAPGTPEVLFAGNYFVGPRIGETINYDVDPDGERFLMIKPNPGAGPSNFGLSQIVVVENWFEELRRQVPVD